MTIIATYAKVGGARTGLRGAICRSIPPSGSTIARIASTRFWGVLAVSLAFSASAERRMSRASASTERPCRAARASSRCFKSSSTFEIVIVSILGYTPCPSREQSSSIRQLPKISSRRRMPTRIALSAFYKSGHWLAMRKLLSRVIFVHCGAATVTNGQPRIATERKANPARRMDLQLDAVVPCCHGHKANLMV